MKFIIGTVVASLTIACSSVARGDCALWELCARINVPRVYNNSESLGKRAYQVQHVHGYFTVEDSSYPGGEPTIEFVELVNKTHKVGGKFVSYEANASAVRWHVIGNNKTGKFATPSVCFQLEAFPSYAIGESPDEDNSLNIVMAARGIGEKRISGRIAGMMGCGCMEYGHVSPTRIWDWRKAFVVDTASVYGTWTAKRIR